MLRANDIIPRNPQLEPGLEPYEHTLDTPTMSETSLGKGEIFKVKKEAESGPEIDDSDEGSIRERAILVRF